VMMAAMMFPSVLPMVVVYDRVSRRHGGTPFFVAGYLLTWTVAGLAAYGLFVAGRAIAGHALAWDRAGRYVAASVLVVAAVYQLTPLKNRCLSKCRGPLRFVLESWREGRVGALRMGAAQGAWCVGCCWALMAALFALGVMSLAWMAFVAALIALEKLAPWRAAANRAIAAGLVVLAVGLAAAPASVPALTVPGSPGARGAMMRMDGGSSMPGGSGGGAMPSEHSAMPATAPPMRSTR
jgi:predicted metal-binding membrane protein